MARTPYVEDNIAINEKIYDWETEGFKNSVSTNERSNLHAVKVLKRQAS